MLWRRDEDVDFAGYSVRAVCGAKTDLRDGPWRVGAFVQCSKDRCAVCTHRRNAVYACVAVFVRGGPEGTGRAGSPAQRAWKRNRFMCYYSMAERCLCQSSHSKEGTC